MRRAPSALPTWPVAVAGFLLGFVAVFRWQQWQDTRLLRQMEAQDGASLASDTPPPPTEDGDETVSRYRDSG